MSAEVPGPVDAGDGNVDDILDDFGDPVSCECNEHQQTDDLGLATSSIGTTTCVARVVAHIDRDHGDREPGAECGSDESSNS